VILLIDNYDSFTYNLVQLVGELGQQREIRVVRNDTHSAEELTSWHPSHVIISPGPGTPDEAGVSIEVVKRFGRSTPILGVCLGHQSIARAFGGEIVRADRLMHGKTSRIHHDGGGVYRGLSNPFTATRYHSLVVDRSTIVPELVATAQTDHGELMGIRHRTLPIEGVQFHPESFMTENGHKLLDNFLQSRHAERGAREVLENPVTIPGKPC